MDELGAVSATDVSGNGHAGAVVNGAAGVDVSGDGMPWDNARQFVRASDQAIQVPQSSALEPANAISFGAWIKVTAVQSTVQVLFRNGDPSTFEGYTMQIRATGDARFQTVVRTAGGDRNFPGFDFTPYFGAWTLVVATYDGRWTRHYANGDLIESNDFGSTAGIIYTADDLYLGGWPTYDVTEKRYLDGLMAEAFVKPDHVMAPWDVKRIAAAVRDPADGLRAA
jgi:hypothetical protein